MDDKRVDIDSETVAWTISCLLRACSQSEARAVAEAEAASGQRIHDEMRLSDDLSKKLNAANAELRRLADELENDRKRLLQKTEQLLIAEEAIKQLRENRKRNG